MISAVVLPPGFTPRCTRRFTGIGVPLDLWTSQNENSVTIPFGEKNNDRI